MTLFLAFRNLLLQKKRYALIFIAIMLGFALITVLTGTAYGCMETVMIKAARYFSGHVSLTGYLNKSRYIEKPEDIISYIKQSELPVRNVSKRTIYKGKEARLYFGGNSVRLRRQIGIDIDSERDEIAELPFIEGSIDEMSGDKGKNGIIISSAASRLLGARLGDDVTLYIKADNGQHNTASMIVRGIFDETSIFGYATYLRNKDLNTLLLRDSGVSTDIAVYAEKGINISSFSKGLRIYIKNKYPVFSDIREEEDLSNIKKVRTEETTFAVIPLEAHLEEIKNILDAFVLGTYFIFIVFMIIVMVGVLNTYRVMIYERTKEIGTMRAIGMQRNQVKYLFLFEAGGLALISSAAGFILGFLILNAIGLIDFSSYTPVAIFLASGKLDYFLNPAIIIINFLIMTLSVMAAAYGPAVKAGKVPPAQALRKEG